MPPASPKGQLPFIDDGGEAVADSTFIRAHIERRYGFDFRGYAPGMLKRRLHRRMLSEKIPTLSALQGIVESFADLGEPEGIAKGGNRGDWIRTSGLLVPNQAL